MTRIWRILTGAVESLKNLHFDWFPLRRVYNIWPKKVQRTYIRWRSRLMQNLKISDLWFGKWHEELGKLSPEHSKVSKSGIWWDPFIQRRKCMGLKFTEELWVMAMKNDAKFGEELTCCFKIEIRNLVNFDPSNRKSQKFAL